jgi:hypothetical protein
MSELLIDYQADYDLLFVQDGPMCACESIEVQPALIVRVSRETGRAVGVEIIDAAGRFNINNPETFEWAAFYFGIMARYAAEAEDAYRALL